MKKIGKKDILTVLAYPAFTLLSIVCVGLINPFVFLDVVAYLVVSALVVPIVVLAIYWRVVVLSASKESLIPVVTSVVVVLSGLMHVAMCYFAVMSV